MDILKRSFAILSNIQILSALIWALVILGCSYITKDSTIFNILIIGAGFHVVLMSKMSGKVKGRETSCAS